MATSDARRRKQLEKKKKKRAEKHHQLTVRQNAGLAEQLKLRSKAPIYQCLVSSNLDDSGLGEVIISRRCLSGDIAFGLFLIDRYCLGVKDCFGRISSKADFSTLLERLAERGTMLRTIDASTARRLIEDSLAYAAQFGIKPHPDYRSARMILGDIDPTQAQELFEMGNDGKPYFMSGPFQSQAECRLIIDKLKATVGEGNFNFTMQVSGDTMLMPRDVDELMFDDDDDDQDDDDESGLLEYDATADTVVGSNQKSDQSAAIAESRE